MIDLTERSLSYTSLKEFAKSPAHFINYRNYGKDKSPAMVFGSAFHAFLLEGEKVFRDRYHVSDKLDRRTKAGKEQWSQLCEQYGEENILMVDDYDRIMRMMDTIRNDEFASPLLSSADTFELEVKYDVDGLPFRGFIDGLKDGDGGFWFDLKTTNDADPNSFKYDFFKRKQHVQHALYYLALNQNFRGVSKSDAWTIVVETKSPYGVTVVNVKEETIDAGLEWIYRQLENFKRCMESNAWTQTYTFNSKILSL